MRAERYTAVLAALVAIAAGAIGLRAGLSTPPEAKRELALPPYHELRREPA